MGQELTQEEVLGESQGGQIIFKTGPRKVKLEMVTPMQWSAANMRVLIELLRTGELKEGSIYDYISYTVKVSELADTYVWVSVMRFDRAYRQLQAQHGFRWGSDSPHLDALHLRARQPGQQFPANSRVTQPPKTASNNQGSRPSLNVDQTCRLFQRNACPWADKGKFQHICAAPGCGQDHPLAMHGKPASKNY